ncbi:hypothetical protein [Methanospirillum sp.]
MVENNKSRYKKPIACRFEKSGRVFAACGSGSSDDDCVDGSIASTTCNSGNSETPF